MQALVAIIIWLAMELRAAVEDEGKSNKIRESPLISQRQQEKIKSLNHRRRKMKTSGSFLQMLSINQTISFLIQLRREISSLKIFCSPSMT
ncbi:MAG: hypothetical protein ACKO96_40815, partial [Flammeovirgaceae bacterium]